MELHTKQLQIGVSRAVAAQLCPLKMRATQLADRSQTEKKEITAWWHCSTHEKYSITITMKIS